MRERKGERFPSYDELLDAAKRVGSRAETPTDSPAIVGGLAMQIWGSPRLTADIDVIADDDLGYEGEPLTFGGVRTREGGVKLDVIVRSDEWEDLYAGALKEAVEVEGVPMPVVTPEFLVAMKMVAGRPKDEIDVRYLVLLKDFDTARAERIARDYLGPYGVKELRAITAEAEWRRSRGEEP